MNIWDVNSGANATRQAVGYEDDGQYVAVQRVKHTTGVYKDYIDEIDSSYKLGWTPYRLIKRNWGHDVDPVDFYRTTSVYVLDDTVYDISSHKLADNGPLIVYQPGVPLSGSYVTVAGPQGPKDDTGIAGPQGPKGDTGIAGPQGPKNDTEVASPKGDVGCRGPQGEKGNEAPVMPAISRWLPASYPENLKENQVAVWFCAAHYPLGTCTLSLGHNLQEMANSSRYKMFEKFPLKFVSGSRAVVKWKTVPAHYKCAENKTLWRTQLYPDPFINVIHYYLAFNKSFYRSSYPLASKKDVCVIIVYNLKGYKDREIENCLFSSDRGVGQHEVCFNQANRSRWGKQCIRTFGVDRPNASLSFQIGGR